jgi:hypothetical protein
MLYVATKVGIHSNRSACSPIWPAATTTPSARTPTDLPGRLGGSLALIIHIIAVVLLRVNLGECVSALVVILLSRDQAVGAYIKVIALVAMEVVLEPRQAAMQRHKRVS